MSEPAIEIIPVDPRIPEALELIEALSEELARQYDYADDGSGDFKSEGAFGPAAHLSLVAPEAVRSRAARFLPCSAM